MTPIPPTPSSPLEGFLPAVPPLSGEFEAVMGPAVEPDRPKRTAPASLDATAIASGMAAQGLVLLLPPLPGLPVFPVARPDVGGRRLHAPLVAELGGPWGVDVGLRITVLEASGGGSEVPWTGPEAPDPEFVQWIEEAIQGVPTGPSPGGGESMDTLPPADEPGAPAGVFDGPGLDRAYDRVSPRTTTPPMPPPGASSVMAPMASLGLGGGPTAAVEPTGRPAPTPLSSTLSPEDADADTEEVTRGPDTSRRIDPSGGEDSASTESGDTDDTYHVSDTTQPGVEVAALSPTFFPEARGVAGDPQTAVDPDPASGEPGASLLHTLPSRLRLAVEDAGGMWELDLHRHAGVMDLVLRGGDDLRLVVRDAWRELREATATPGVDPGAIRWEPTAPPSSVASPDSADAGQPSTSSGNGEPTPEFERWRSLVEGRVDRRKPGANQPPPPGLSASHLLDRRL